MIDLSLLRENPELLRQSLRQRGGEESLVDAAIAADQHRRDAIAHFESLRASQNAFGKDVAKASGDERQRLLAEVKELSQKVKEASALASVAEEQAATALGALPNVVLEGVPSGGEENFVTLREVGTPPTFDGDPVITATKLLTKKTGRFDMSGFPPVIAGKRVRMGKTPKALSGCTNSRS